MKSSRSSTSRIVGLSKTIKFAAVGSLGMLLSTGVIADSSVKAQKQLAAKRDFQNYCANCHGDDGRGDGPFTQMYGVYPIDIRLLELNNDGKFPTTYVRNLIDGREDIRLHGKRTMPGWFAELWSSPEGSGARQANDRINALTDYLARIQISEND